MKEDALQAFLVFSETMNFTRAAEQLHISQPALHVKIQKLADSIGLPLYEKQGRSLLLTQAGVKVQGFAREWRERRRMFLAGIRQVDDDQPVVLAAGEGVYLYLISSAVMKFNRGKRHLRLLTGDSSYTVDAVLTGRAHLGVAVLSVPPPELHSTTYTTVGQVLVVPRNHGLSGRKKVALQDIEGEKLILPPLGRPHRVLVEQALAEQGVNWSLAVEAGGWELMVHFVKLGAGISIVNACCHIPTGLVKIPLHGLPVLRYYLLERKQSWQIAAVQELKETLLRHRGDWKRTLNG